MNVIEEPQPGYSAITPDIRPHTIHLPQAPEGTVFEVTVPASMAASSPLGASSTVAASSNVAASSTVVTHNVDPHIPTANSAVTPTVPDTSSVLPSSSVGTVAPGSVMNNSPVNVSSKELIQHLMNNSTFNGCTLNFKLN